MNVRPERVINRSRGERKAAVLGVMLLIWGMTGYADEANTDVAATQPQNTKEQLQYSQEQRDDLSCSKQARRLHKLADKEKRRQFIAECRAEREARQRAVLDQKAKELSNALRALSLPRKRSASEISSFTSALPRHKGTPLGASRFSTSTNNVAWVASLIVDSRRNEKSR